MKPVPKFHFGVASDQGKRNYMEDRDVVIEDFRPLGQPDDPNTPRTTLAGVFDGHLSAKAAELAANNLHAFLEKEEGYLQALDRKKELQQEGISLAMRRAFQRCDHHILAASKSEDNWKGGTTACVALTIDEHLFVGHVGDSGAFVIRDGRARRLTLDHKPTNPAEKERISNAGGTVNTTLDRVYSAEAGTMLAMSRALGDANFKEGSGDAFVSNRPDVRHLRLVPEDVAIVIASDGLFDVLSDQHAADLVLSAKSEHQDDLRAVAKSAAASLVHQSLSEGSSDNITALVMLLEWPINR